MPKIDDEEWNKLSAKMRAAIEADDDEDDEDDLADEEDEEPEEDEDAVIARAREIMASRKGKKPPVKKTPAKRTPVKKVPDPKPKRTGFFGTA